MHSNAVSRGFRMIATLAETIGRLKFGVSDALDIIIVAWIIYEFIAIIKKNNITNLAIGIGVVVAVLGISGAMKLNMTHTLLNKAIELGLIAVVILFQPELRGTLERIGGGFVFGNRIALPTMDSAIAQVVLACEEMSAEKTGALIIFERDVKLTEIIRSGTAVNADVNAQLLENIFYKGAPLHDGALIIRDSKIAAAGCILPVSHRTDLSKELGLRHRAGIGVSEKTDAVVIIVSEESGAISVSVEGMLKRHLASGQLDRILRTELMPAVEQEHKTIFDQIKDWFGGKKA